MRLLLVALIALQINFAQAADTAFESCQSLPVMAVLAKDNYPYWTTPAVKYETAEDCYELVLDVTHNGSPEDIELLKAELNGQLQIFKTDAEFSQFINQQAEFEQMQIENPHNVKPHLVPLVKHHFGFAN